ncbi:hypothetical protein GQ600_5222 [Phytophthora cactorum]|nr:hypothetical protein GQ600_5222 [Phytophthora cactorum]
MIRSHFAEAGDIKLRMLTDKKTKKSRQRAGGKTKALIQKHIDGREYKLKQEDVDDRMIDFLSWFDYETAKKALDEYNRCVSDKVNNRKAFFMAFSSDSDRRTESSESTASTVVDS